jgi:hypothetical protein
MKPKMVEHYMKVAAKTINIVPQILVQICIHGHITNKGR